MDLASMKLDFLQKAKTEGSLEQLESSVQVGIQLLEDIKSTISSAKDIKEVAKFLKSIEKVKKKGGAQRAVIGVVGGTGAGKSSVINALLNEKALVPTSGMRACTAVITEISFNHSSNQNELYRAEVQFISAQDWKDELRILLDEMKTHGENPDVDLSEGEVGIAYSKLKAVYPSITKDELLAGQHTPESLAQHAAVELLLGSKVEFSERSPENLSKSLQKYIDTKEKQHGQDRGGGHLMEYWPLVKVVHIFTKSPVLESGLVLVDLPGVHDSNAARSAVAARYIEECTGLWVIAAITRAVDDKSAQNLLGESFRRQLQIDGSYSAITFICSKTDDLNIEEIMRAMPEGEDALETNVKLHLAQEEVTKLDTELAPMEGRMKELGSLIENLQKEIIALEAAINTTSEGNSPSGKVSLTPTRKRKQRTAAMQSRKKTQVAMQSDAEDSSSDSDTDEDELAASDCEMVEELSQEDATRKLEQLKGGHKAAWDDKESLTKKAKPVKKAKKEANRKVKDLKSNLENQCLEFRNGFVIPTIKQQFADGLREIDQEIGFQRDPNNFDPDFQARDYREIAERLPVFCVSSRAYQQKSRLLPHSRPYPGFRTLEDTQMPQLKAHARAIVRNMRISNCRNFLGLLEQCLTSLMVQVVLAEKPLKIADDLREEELKFLGKEMRQLEENLEDSILSCIKSLTKVVKLNILDKLPAAARAASDEAPQTVLSWGKPREEGGLAMGTYRATCVRAGVFKGARGLRNMNEELAIPLIKVLAQSWENAFSSYIPKRLDHLAENLTGHLKKLQGELEKRPQITQSVSYGLVKQQTMAFAEGILDISALRSDVDVGQREASRICVPTISREMSSVYKDISKESGRGSLARIREKMETHVENVRAHMFHRAARKVESRLTSMIDNLQASVKDRVQEVTSAIDADYRSLIEGKNVFTTFVHARKELRLILLSANERFRSIVEPEDNDVGPPEQMDVDQPQVPSPVEQKPIIKPEPTT
ncbi:hypothetical protein V8F20_008479 [Naviculisporaceae sp. PSN 640]